MNTNITRRNGLKTVPDVYTVAVLKGAVEGDVTKHLASLLALRQHVALAHAWRLVGQNGQDLTGYEITATEHGVEIYQRHKLATLPNVRGYLWLNERHSTTIVQGLINELLDAHRSGTDSSATGQR